MAALSVSPAILMSATPFIVPYCDRPIGIVFVDDDLIVVDKPYGLLSVPGRDIANRDCVPSRLRDEFGELRIIHRLDLDTSGIMVLARNAEAHRRVNRQFEQREVEKFYEALVWGLPAEDNGKIELPIIVDWPNRPKKIVDPVNGKHALTYYRVLERDAEKNISRVELKPITGRSHQLRVHLAEIGHPILGCPFYAHDEARNATDRLMLHARQLQLTHPSSGEVLLFKAPRFNLPARFNPHGDRHTIRPVKCPTGANTVVTLHEDPDEALLIAQPNNSANWRLNKLIIAAFALWWSLIAGFFVLRGLWPIVPFVGLEVGGLALALYYVCWKTAAAPCVALQRRAADCCKKAPITRASPGNSLAMRYR